MHKTPNKPSSTPLSSMLLALLFVLGSLCFSSVTIAQQVGAGQDSLLAFPMSQPEGLSFSNSLLNREFDFELTPTANGKFQLSFYNNTNKEEIEIKVYDIIGNLIMHETLPVNGQFSKEYDMSVYKTRLFVVEVGNSKYNKAKSVIAG